MCVCVCVIGRWRNFKAAWQHSLNTACLHCSVESAFLCLIFPRHSTRSSLLLAACPRLSDVYPNTPLPLHPSPYSTCILVHTHNCTLHLAIKARQDPAASGAPTSRGTFSEEGGGEGEGITCTVAPQEGRRCSLPLPLSRSRTQVDIQMHKMSIWAMSDRNICAESSWKALSAFPEHKSGCFNACLRAKVKYSSEKENNYAANYKVCCKQSAATSEDLSADVFVTIYWRGC